MYLIYCPLFFAIFLATLCILWCSPFLDQKFVGLGALLFVVPWSVHEVMKSHRNLCGFYNYFYYDHVGQLVVIK